MEFLFTIPTPHPTCTDQKWIGTTHWTSDWFHSMSYEYSDPIAWKSWVSFVISAIKIAFLSGIFLETHNSNKRQKKHLGNWKSMTKLLFTQEKIGMLCSSKLLNVLRVMCVLRETNRTKIIESKMAAKEFYFRWATENEVNNNSSSSSSWLC